MLAAFELASRCLPDYSNKFSRKDFTLPQLFACLAAKEHLKRSYRGAAALLADCPHWLRDIGLAYAPDHNTLCRAAKFLLAACRVSRLLDAAAAWAARARILGLSRKPLALDSTCFESRHVSRHYERRCKESKESRKEAGAGAGAGAGAKGRRPARGRGSGEKARRRGIRHATRRMPKLALGVSSRSHLILSARASTGAGGDQPHFGPLALDAWRRVPHRSFTVVADAGFDSEPNHRVARHDMGLRSVIPPDIGRPRKDGGPPGGRWRGHMKRQLATKDGRRRSGYTQRWQVETVNSMMKRNLGSALSGKTAWSRKRDMRLKVLTHDLMVL
jgi:hypothetical protein